MPPRWDPPPRGDAPSRPGPRTLREARSLGPRSAGRGGQGLALRGEEGRDLPHDSARDLVPLRARDAPMPGPAEMHRGPEADGQRVRARHIKPPSVERLVRAVDRRGDDGDAGPERDQRDTGMLADEAALSTERALREDADDAARVERSQHALDGARVGTLEVDGD